MLTMRSPIWREETIRWSECSGGRFMRRSGYCPAGCAHRAPIVAGGRRSGQAPDLWGLRQAEVGGHDADVNNDATLHSHGGSRTC